MIGLLVIVALVILYFGINFLKGVNIFKAANYYYASYNNVEGLAVSAPVTLNGYKVGLVREIQYDFARPGHVTVEMSLDKSLKLPPAQPPPWAATCSAQRRFRYSSVTRPTASTMSATPYPATSIRA